MQASRLFKKARLHSMRKYPHLKVLLWFSMCPAVGGVCLALTGAYHAALEPEINEISIVAFTAATSLLMATIATIVNIPPAFALASLYSFLRLYRSWQSYLLVGVLGGGGAFFWGVLISPINDGKDYWTAISDSWLATPFTSAFFLGAISSLSAAFWALPKKCNDPV